ncbi:MAG: hypothetical protein WD096_07505 [Actinomycetota bacterium]
MKSGRVITIATLLAIAAGTMATYTWAAGRAPGGVDPSNFTDPVANTYFPLEPGTVLILKGSEGGEALRERVRITAEHRMIEGVSTVVVHDVIRSHGALVEKTIDWYAADNDGNVWYFGEDTATYDADGNVQSTEGTWLAGFDGAVAGIIMPADPRPTDAYRQEFYVGHAEDQGWIVQRGAKVSVPYGDLNEVVRSFEWTRLEPGVMAQKFYAPGLGIVLEMDVAGGNELLSLVKVIKT